MAAPPAQAESRTPQPQRAVVSTSSTSQVVTYSNAEALAKAYAKKAPPPPPPDEQEDPYCEMYLYDAIGADFFGNGITAISVANALKDAEAAGAKSLNLYVNSPGGDVFEGTAIYNLLDRFPGPKSVYIDGLAASAASYIAMVGDTITTAPNAMWMIHDPWGVCLGNATDMRDAADLLEKVGGTLIATYAARTKLPDAIIKNMMASETWMTADEALAKGFTDKVASPGEQDDTGNPDEADEGEPQKLAARASAVLNRYKNTPKALRPDSRALIASMEQRASPRAVPTPAVAKK